MKTGNFNDFILTVVKDGEVLQNVIIHSEEELRSSMTFFKKQHSNEEIEFLRYYIDKK